MLYHSRPISLFYSLSPTLSHSLHASRGSITEGNLRLIRLHLLLLLHTCLLWQLLQGIGAERAAWLGVCFFIFNKVICADNMKNILRPGFARTYSLLMDSPDNFSFWVIFCIFFAYFRTWRQQFRGVDGKGDTLSSYYCHLLLLSLSLLIIISLQKLPSFLKLIQNPYTVHFVPPIPSPPFCVRPCLV